VDAPGRIALGENNVWVLPLHPDDGGGWLLIDAGIDGTIGFESTWNVALDQAQGLGFTPHDVRVVVVTHEHIDHAGLAARWATSGTTGHEARIVCGRAAIPSLVAGIDTIESQREPRFAELERHGMPPELVALFRARTNRLRWPPCPRDAIDAAEDHSTFRLADGTTLRLLVLPGHTPGNLVAWIEEAHTLFSGDTVIPTTIPTAGLHFPRAVEGDPTAPRWPSLPAFLEAVAAVRALRPVRIYPGHGEVIDDPTTYLDRFETHHARRGAKVRAYLEAHAPCTAFEVVRGVFTRLPDERLLQAMTEVLGHLDLLEARGEATRSVTGREAGRDVVRWSLT